MRLLSKLNIIVKKLSKQKLNLSIQVAKISKLNTKLGTFDFEKKLKKFQKRY